MKRRREATVIALLASLLGGAGVAQASSKDQVWRDDIAALHSTLPARHANLFFRTTREAWDAAVSDLSASVPALQDYEVVVGLMKVVAMIGDSHTTINVLPAGFRSYPLQFAPFSDGLYVVGATQQTASALGARIVAIGETPIEDAVEAVGAVVPHENDAWLRAQSPQWLTKAEVLAALRLAPDTEHASFILEDKNGQRRLDLSPMPLGTPLTLSVPDPSVPTPAYRRNLNLNYWLEYEPVSRTLLFEYNRCAPMPSPTPEEFSKSLLAAANANPIARAVIDLRNNGGGDSTVLNRLVADVAINRPDLAAPGTFSVIIGNQTFSSAMLNAVTLRQNGGVLYGEPTGGKPTAYAEIQSFALPNSGFAVFYSTKLNRLVDGDPPSVDPDVFVPISFDQYLAGRDPVLEAIVNRRTALVPPPPARPRPISIPAR
jgi:hypothetical protein